MINLETIKNHLEELFPNILVFYYLEDISAAKINKNTSCIAINKYNLFYSYPNENYIFDKFVENNEDKADDMAINLFILLLHECMGHKKFGFNRSKSISPKKIINEKNNILELGRTIDYKDDGKEYILGRSCRNKGDSGSFLEMAYGKYKKKLITGLMLFIPGKGKLIKRADLFTESSCETLRKYIILKYNAKERKITIQENNSIENDILQYEKVISENINQEESELQLLNKKKKRSINKNEEDNSSMEREKKRKMII